MHLDHTFGLRLSLSEIASLYGLSRYLDRTFGKRIGSAKVKSKSEVTRCQHLNRHYSIAEQSVRQRLIADQQRLKQEPSCH